ncbi:hypothetical protein DY467_01005 [Rhodopseudomonas sp. BR0G17]|nr:hypothetical protein [Rhodopseudomonas sp. BR0G17]
MCSRGCGLISTRSWIRTNCHCEERSDEAIQRPHVLRPLDCFASLAMTGDGHPRLLTSADCP